MEIEGPPYKIKKSSFTVFCMKYRQRLEIITQIVIILLFVILVPIIATSYRTYVLEGRRGYIVYVSGNRGSAALIIIYIVGLLFHYFLEFSGIFFRHLWNFYSRTEFGNLYFSLINNNNIKLNFIDDKDFMFSEISYAQCQDISNDFMEEELNKLDNKFCIVKASLNFVVNEEQEYLYFQNRTLSSAITGNPQASISTIARGHESSFS